MKATIEWIGVDDGLPGNSASVLAAVTGRYPADPGAEPESSSGEQFWLVLPMFFRWLHPVEETGEVLKNCFVDPDHVVRFPRGGPSSEVVTHWAELPNLPGSSVGEIRGDGVEGALRRAAESRI
jgi:hypothetical protein